MGRDRLKVLGAMIDQGVIPVFHHPDPAVCIQVIQACADGGAKEADPPESGAQIWVIPVDGGEATKLTDHKGDIRSFEWAKDNASIVFAAERAKSDAQKAGDKAGDGFLNGAWHIAKP